MTRAFAEKRLGALGQSGWKRFPSHFCSRSLAKGADYRALRLGRIDFRAVENGEGTIRRFHLAARSEYLPVPEQRGRVNGSRLIHTAGQQP
jgi:hypothetical protein